MSEESYQKVGRGGAGNFWSQKDVEEAQTHARNLEARTISTTHATGTLDQVPPPEFVRTGRGGAGNYVPPAELSNESKDLACASKIGLESVRKVTSEKPSYRALSGRGGAGNFRQAAEEDEKMKAQEDNKLKSKVNEQVRIDVEAMMKPPPKAYAAPESYDARIV